MKHNKFITVYTPTYNRAFCLPRLYKSLLEQKFKDFIWLIIDDGSSDDTASTVKSWIIENLISIQYIQQVNKGMLGAHNSAHKNLTTELAICIDSDDFLAHNALEEIYSIWVKVSDDPKVSGIIGLDSFENGEIIGQQFPKSDVKLNFSDTVDFAGDKKYIYRTDLLQKYGPYPEIAGEKFPAQRYLYWKIGVDYQSFVVNKVLCVVEYLEGGNSATKILSYKRNPVGFMLYRELCMEVEPRLTKRIRNSIHYISSCIFAKKYAAIFFHKHWYYTIFTFPLGILLNIFISRTKSQAVNKNLKL